MKCLALALACLSLLAPTRAAVPGTEELADIILEMDQSGDGALDGTEFRSGTDEGFAEIDSDRDGKITAAEIDALSGPIGQEHGSVAGSVVPPLIKLVLMTMDKDDDKALSKTEYTQGAAAIFALLDADKNATVSRAELVKLPAQLLKSAVP